jgi:hypothetical protein
MRKQVKISEVNPKFTQFLKVIANNLAIIFILTSPSASQKLHDQSSSKWTPWDSSFCSVIAIRRI